MNEFYEFKDEDVREESSINFFMTKVYGWMSCGLILTSIVSWYTTKIPILINLIYYNQLFLITIVIFQVILVYTISNMIFVLSRKTATILFLIYSILNGLTLSGIFFIYTLNSIYNIFLITSITFLFMTIYGYVTKRNLTNIGSLLLMLLFGSLMASAINIIFNNTLLMYLLSYISVFIFTGLVSYDTQKLKYLGNNLHISDEDILNKYAILGALILYLDFINLFLIPLKIIGKKIDYNNDNDD